MQEIETNVFELWVFYSNPQLLMEIDAEKPAGFVVDLEKKGKYLRQKLYDTQISEHSIRDLKKARQLTNAKVITRINPQTRLNKDEINEVLDAGADELLIPMVESVEEIEKVLATVNDRAEVGIMLETNKALQIASELDKLPLSRFYVGLNDLAIENRQHNIFTPMIDGTIEDLRAKVSKKFGIAGLTHPNFGYPIPCAMLIRMMIALDCSFGILRRSFYRDLAKASTQEIFSALRESFENPDFMSISETIETDKSVILNTVF